MQVFFCAEAYKEVEISGERNFEYQRTGAFVANELLGRVPGCTFRD